MKLAAVVTLFIMCECLLAQTREETYEIGTYFDLEGNVIHGYFDDEYEAVQKFVVQFKVGADFTPARYYDLNNHKISGLLTYDDDSPDISFKYGEGCDIRNLSPENCNGNAVAADSFTVIRNFGLEGHLHSKEFDSPQFAQVLDHVGDYTFYSQYGGSFSLLYGGVKTTRKILFSKGDSDSLTVLPAKAQDFQEIGLEVFGDVPFLKTLIYKAEFGPTQLTLGYKFTEIIKFLKYFKIYESNGKLYFNQYWDEVDDPDANGFYAEVKSVEDSIFHLKYFKQDGTPIYEGKYANFYPQKRRGSFTWYYPDGTIRKITKYRDSKPNFSVNNYPNGQPHTYYSWDENKKTITAILNQNGEAVLDQEGYGKYSFYDPVRGSDIHCEVERFQYANVYYLKEGRKVFLKCEKNTNLPPRLYQPKDVSLDYPLESLSNFEHGYVLVKVDVDAEGAVTDMSVIKSLSKECDNLALLLMDNELGYKEFDPGKSSGKKVAQEIVIPVEFVIKGSSPYRGWSIYDNLAPSNPAMNLPLHNNMMPPNMPRSFR